MKKVGIITLIGNNNYGNRLQNYAVQEVLCKLGFEGTTILHNKYCGSKKEKTIRIILNIFRFPILYSLNRFYNVMYKKIISIRMKVYMTEGEKGLLANTVLRRRLNTEREKRFSKFVVEKINESPCGITSDSIPDDLSTHYDYFVIGSDQVWNPSFKPKPPFAFLSFTNKGKRIAYAASFGISSIPPVFCKEFQAGLWGMQHISVREEQGTKIVYDLIGKDTPILIDPTMMLDSTDWRKIAIQDVNRPTKPYILTYFLGNIENDVMENISRLASISDFDIVNLNDINDENRYVISPGEFIDYIDHAELIVTDSFHGTVFSILFQRPFIVCNRIGKSEPMLSRITTLLTKFELLDRRAEVIGSSQEVLYIDFSRVPQILDMERQKSLSFLKNALFSVNNEEVDL